jgi:hypothetical protein
MKGSYAFDYDSSGFCAQILVEGIEQSAVCNQVFLDTTMETKNSRYLDVVKENIRLKAIKKAIKTILEAKTKAQMAEEFGVFCQAVVHLIEEKYGFQLSLRTVNPLY